MKRCVRCLTGVVVPILFMTACGVKDAPEAWTPPEEHDTTAASEDTQVDQMTEQTEQEETTAELPSATTASPTTTATATSTTSRPSSAKKGSVNDGSKSDGASCGTLTADQAVRNNLHRLTPAKWDWTAEWADLSGYDPCASLSWAVVTIEHGTSTSPYQIMLFHKGEYLGTGTLDAYAFKPNVTRTSDTRIDVTYYYSTSPGGGGINRAETYASFTWDEVAQKVVMGGNVPPT